MSTSGRPYDLPPLPPELRRPHPFDVERLVADAVSQVLGPRLGREVAGIAATREADGRWAVVVRLSRPVVDDGRGGVTEPSELVATAVREGRLAELLNVDSATVTDAGPMVTVTATVPGDLGKTVVAAILAAAPDAEVTSPRKSDERTLTVTLPEDPKKPTRE